MSTLTASTGKNAKGTNMLSINNLDLVMLDYIERVSSGEIDPVTFETFIAWSQFHYYELDN